MPKTWPTHANFEILEDSDDRLLIQDVGPWHLHRSVTNDAEHVVALLAPQLEGRRLEYLDSAGDRDELLVDPTGRFDGFRSVDAPDPLGVRRLHRSLVRQE
jgi:hypothetical protein